MAGKILYICVFKMMNRLALFVEDWGLAAD